MGPRALFLLRSCVLLWLSHLQALGLRLGINKPEASAKKQRMQIPSPSAVCTHIWLFPKKACQEFMKGRMFDSSDTYSDTYPHDDRAQHYEAYPQTYRETYPIPNMLFWPRFSRKHPYIHICIHVYTHHS